MKKYSILLMFIIGLVLLSACGKESKLNVSDENYKEELTKLIQQNPNQTDFFEAELVEFKDVFKTEKIELPEKILDKAYIIVGYALSENLIFVNTLGQGEYIYNYKTGDVKELYNYDIYRLIMEKNIKFYNGTTIYLSAFNDDYLIFEGNYINSFDDTEKKEDIILYDIKKQEMEKVDTIDIEKINILDTATENINNIENSKLLLNENMMYYAEYKKAEGKTLIHSYDLKSGEKKLVSDKYIRPYNHDGQVYLLGKQVEENNEMYWPFDSDNKQIKIISNWIKDLVANTKEIYIVNDERQLDNSGEQVENLESLSDKNGNILLFTKNKIINARINEAFVLFEIEDNMKNREAYIYSIKLKKFIKMNENLEEKQNLSLVENKEKGLIFTQTENQESNKIENILYEFTYR